MRALFLQSPVAAVAAVAISLPVGIPAANVAADNANQPSVALSASAHSFDKLAETPGLKLVLSAVDSVVEMGAGLAAAAAPQFKLLALPDSIAALVTKDGTGAVPSTFIDAGRTAAGNIVAGLNASSASPLAAPIDVPIPDSVLDLLNLPLSILYGFTSGLAEPTIPLQKLLIALGNYVGLPINIAGLAALGQFDLIPTTIDSITKALTAAWAGLSPSATAASKSTLAEASLDTDSVDDDKDTLKATTGDDEVDGASGASGSGASIDDGTSNGGQPTGTAKPDAENEAENEAENTDGVDREDGEDGATPGTSTPGTGTAGSGSGTNGTPGEPGSHSDDADPSAG